MNKEIKNVVVIGAGSMGHQISMLCALGGFETCLQDIEDKSLEKAQEKLIYRMNDWVNQGKITKNEKNKRLINLT